MKINKGSLYIFFASIILGVLFVVNISFQEKDYQRGTFISAKEYQENLNTRTSLMKELASLRDEYEENLHKVEKYKDSSQITQQVLDDMKNEVDINKMLLGYESIQGQGISMVISDGSVDHTLGIDDPYLQNLRTVHNYDMMQVINELKLAGAEAISINNQRILPNSEIYCSWAFISVNGVKLPSPFKVKAIGDRDVLEKYLTRAESYTKTLINRGINVYINKEDVIVMPSISNGIKTNFIKSNN